MAVVLSFQDRREDASGSATVTYNAGGDPGCGAAAADRIVIIAAYARSATASGITSVTIGGISATHAAGAFVADPTPALQADIWYALVPTGTTCTVTIAWANTTTQDSAITVWRLTGANPKPTAVTTASAGPNAGTNLALSSYTVPTGGASLQLYVNRGGLDLNNAVTWSGVSATDFTAQAVGTDREYGGARVTSGGTASVTASDTTGSDASGTNQAVLTSAAWGPLIFFDDTSFFPVRRRFRPSVATPEFIQPPSGTVTPTQFGFDWNPQFPIRRRFRTFQSADEQWPFTAVPTPAQFGWDNPEKFSQRIKYRPKSTLADEEWPFTAATLGIFGWDNPEKFPSRARYRPRSTYEDQEWPFTAVPTPAQFGWDNPEKFSQRIKFRPSQSADEQWPFTAVPTPTQLGFVFPDPPPIRSRPRQLALSSKQDEQWPFLVIATPIFVPYDTQFPIRARFRTFQSNDEEWLFTAVLTPTQTGFLTQDPTPIIRRPQQLALMSKEDEQWLLSAVGPTTLEGAWYVDQTFPPVTAASPGAWFSPHAWFIKVI